MRAHAILYVRDQAASARFYREVFGFEPSLDVEGMTEFTVTPSFVLGLMPERGIRALLGDAIRDPASASGVPRAEVYLVDLAAPILHERALRAGARELSPMQRRSWGDDAAYVEDPDGHVIAFATSQASPAIPAVRSGSPTRESAVTLREVTRDTVRSVVRLDVASTQRSFVAPNGLSIAQAHFAETAWFRAVYADDVPVGFVMLNVDVEKREYYLWRYMIDARFQRLGYGRRALRLVIDHVRALPGATALVTSTVPGEGSPRPFYEGLGFVATGEMDDGEEVLRLAL